MRRLPYLLTFASLFSSLLVAQAGDWPQFRGVNAAGLAPDKDKLPARLDMDENLIWKIPLPPGHSSPILCGDRIYVTAERKDALLTVALERSTGKVLWEAEAPHQVLEKIHGIGSHAQASPACDGERVISFFGSCGLFCYDREGKQQWHLPLGPFKNDFGAGSSPILSADRVILSQDHDTDSFLMALDKKTGQPIWKSDRSEFPRSYATPVLWEVNGKKQIVVLGTLRVVGYDFDTGKELWTVRGLARIADMTPVVGSDGVLYVAAWSPGADANDRISTPPFDQIMAENDRNKNGTLEPEEVPAGPLKDRFTQIDRDKDGHITRAEYEYMRSVFSTAQNAIVAIKPGGAGDITNTNVTWAQHKLLPYVPSPLYYNGLLFMVKNGGIVNCLDARTGKPNKQERVPGGGDYYSSPVGGDGKVYLLSQKGDLSVITAEREWKLLSRTRFEEEAFATPMVCGGCFYVRTGKHLYCFGTRHKKQLSASEPKASAPGGGEVSPVAD